VCPYLLLKRAPPQRTGKKKCKRRHWDLCHLQGLPGYIWQKDSFSVGGKMVRELHVDHHSLNFLLKNYISKNYFNTSLEQGDQEEHFVVVFVVVGLV
jgi:hypothetical protein